MAGYVIANIQVRDEAEYERYKQMVGPTVEQYGGRYLARGGETRAVEGTWPPGRLVVIEFPTYEDALRWHSSPEYAPAKAQRQRCAEGDLVIAAGL